MRQYRTCSSCRNKLEPNEFDSADDVWCRSCSLIGKRLNQKFTEMVESPITGLVSLGQYLDEWYVIV
jgi:hypothetical protein